MTYLTTVSEIRSHIAQFTTYPILWLDTEVADWYTPNPRLSLIQVLADLRDSTGELAYILDVLDRPDLVQEFVEQIMYNGAIEKVFHNARYDLQYLGGNQAQNVTCTFRMSQRISKKKLGTSNRKLKTLAQELCHFTEVDAEEQKSDWGKRPLSEKQLHYARMDTVYLAHVHQYLLNFSRFQPIPVSQTNHSKKSEINQKNSSFSVTQVRVAFECPRLFYLARHFGGMTLFLPEGRALGIGNAFHDLSNQFVKTAIQQPQFTHLLTPAIDQLNAETVATEMQSLFFSTVFFPYLQSVTQTEPGKAPALLQLWNGLKSLIQRWARLLVSNRQFCTAEEVIAKTFLAQELSVQYPFFLPDRTSQQVRGRFDSLVYDFANHRLCVVEYKTYQSPDPSAQLAQVALYGYMLRQKVGVPIDSAVYTVLPDWQELMFTWDELETTIHQLIPHKLQQMRQWVDWQTGQLNPPPPTAQPHLCAICPQRQKCQTFFSTLVDSDSANSNHSDSTNSNWVDSEPAEPSPPLQHSSQPTQPVTDQAIEAEAIGTNLIETLQSFGMGTTYQGAVLAPAFIRVKLKPNPGVKVNSILKLSDDLRVQLGLAHPPLIAPQTGYISVDLPRPDRQIAAFDRYIQPQPGLPTDPIRIAIGINLEGQLVEADLSDPNTCHFLIGGTTGSGKSECLRSMLLSLLVRHVPEHLKIALVDPKRVTFPEFEQIPWLYTPVVKESDRAIALMEQLMNEMDRRYQRFEQAQCTDLSGYNQRQTEPMPRIVCIFDEYADFMAEKETRTALELSIKRLGAMARAAGIHLIIATQRPEARVVTPLIRSNLPGRIALRTASEADSTIILGGKQVEAAYLLGKGDLLYQAGAHRFRLQSLFAPTIDLRSQQT